MKILLTILFALTTAAMAYSQEVNRYIQKGNDAYRRNDYSGAISLYRQALQKDTGNAIAKFNMANALQKRNENTASLDNYDEIAAATREISLRSHAMYNKGLALVNEKKLVEAIESFKRSLLSDPTDNEARDNLQKAMNELKKQQQSQPQQNKQNEKQDKPQQKKQPKVNRDMMEQKFRELQNQEKQLQKKLQKKQNNGQPEKDW